MGKCSISQASLGETGFSYTLSLINGKYKMTILYTLMEFGVVRFNEMKKYIGEISYKTLSVTLKELEGDQGKSLIPILDMMCEWGEKHRLPSRREQNKADI